MMQQERQEIEGSRPSKKVKVEPNFYLIQRKITSFIKFDEYPQFNKINMTLTNISESISKPSHISQYQINEASLIRAKALGQTSKTVLSFLGKYSKNKVSKELIQFVEEVMETKSATKLYLLEGKEKNYYVFQHEDSAKFPEDLVALLVKRIPNSFSLEINEEKSFQTKQLLKWQVRAYGHNELAKRLFELKIPVMSQKVLEKKQLSQEVNTRGDMFRSNKALHCKNLKISLKAFTKLRDYQAQALKAVVYHHPVTDKKIAKSGYIVLPCGAGKTLLGISICAKVRKETLIVCSSDSGAEQWKRQIEKWTQGIERDNIIILTAKTDSNFSFKANGPAHIFITTYSNLKAKLEVRDKEGDKKDIKVDHEWMRMMPWGLVVFDQAQWLPAPGNSLIANSLIAHVKIGLTATPLREDENIQSLIYMIGPRLYEGSWRKFVQNGYLASPKCVEIRTKLTEGFQRLFDDCNGRQKQQFAIVQCNPNKIKTILLLLEYHEQLGDQIIVFCDRISFIHFLARKLKRPLLTGQTQIDDRNFVFDMFRQGKFKTLFLSRIGDEAIDLPNATVGIEINIHKGSRRQMLQRLGRVMRPKDSNVSSTYNAMFYTIVTDDTPEIRFFNKRRECLINLGFQYDLKFSCFGEDAMADIFADESNDYVRKAVQKFKSVMQSSQQVFWAFMKSKKTNTDIMEEESFLEGISYQTFEKDSSTRHNTLSARR